MGNVECTCFCSLHVGLTKYALKVKDPVKYPTDVKPAELNLYSTHPRTKAAHAQNMPMGGYNQAPGFGMAHGPPGPMNFGGYYPPYGYGMSPWYLPPPPPIPAAAPPPAPKKKLHVEFPKISEWLRYCDQHPQRGGENLSTYAWKFDKEGYRRINQLTGDRISVEKLSEWLNIGKGIADLIIRYAEEDVELVKAGEFQMELQDMGEIDYE
jgi:hypothetical protein